MRVLDENQQFQQPCCNRVMLALASGARASVAIADLAAGATLALVGQRGSRFNLTADLVEMAALRGIAIAVAAAIELSFSSGSAPFACGIQQVRERDRDQHHPRQGGSVRLVI